MAVTDRKFNLEKQPSEKFTVGVDFDKDLGTGEVILSTVITATDLSDGSDVSAALLDGSASINGAVVSQTIKGGTDGKLYKLTFKASTDASHIFEADILLTVQEL